MGDFQPHPVALLEIRQVARVASRPVGVATVWILAQASEIGGRWLARCALRVRGSPDDLLATLARPGGEVFLGPRVGSRVGLSS